MNRRWGTLPIREMRLIESSEKLPVTTSGQGPGSPLFAPILAQQPEMNRVESGQGASSAAVALICFPAARAKA